MSDKAEKPEGRDVEEKGERRRMKKNESRELKLRYLNSFSGLAAAVNSDTGSRVQKKVFERLVDDPHFDVFFLSSTQFCSLETNQNNCEKDGEKNSPTHA